MGTVRRGHECPISSQTARSARDRPPYFLDHRSRIPPAHSTPKRTGLLLAPQQPPAQRSWGSSCFLSIWTPSPARLAILAPVHPADRSASASHRGKSTATATASRPTATTFPTPRCPEQNFRRQPLGLAAKAPRLCRSTESSPWSCPCRTWRRKPAESSTPGSSPQGSCSACGPTIRLPGPTGSDIGSGRFGRFWQRWKLATGAWRRQGHGGPARRKIIAGWIPLEYCT